MCPFYNPDRKECKVTPWDSSAPRSEGEISSYCKGNYRNCGNYEAYERGDYKVER